MAGEPGATAVRLVPEVGGRAAGVGGAAAPGGGGNRAPGQSSGPARAAAGVFGCWARGAQLSTVQRVGDSPLWDGVGGAAEAKGQEGEGSAERLSGKAAPQVCNEIRGCRCGVGGAEAVTRPEEPGVHFVCARDGCVQMSAL